MFLITKCLGSLGTAGFTLVLQLANEVLFGLVIHIIHFAVFFLGGTKLSGTICVAERIRVTLALFVIKKIIRMHSKGSLDVYK